MSPLQRIVLAASAAALLALTFLVGPFAPLSGDRPSPGAPAPVSPEKSVAATPPTDSRAALPGATPPGAAPVFLAPEEIRRVLPSITERVANWKEFKPAKITIAPYPDLPFEFTATSIGEEHGRTVWTGRNTIEGAFLVAAATENEWHATLVIPGSNTFEVFISGNNVTLTEKLHDEEQCAGALPLKEADIAQESGSFGSLDQPIMAHDVQTVDVLFFYDAAALEQVQGHAATIETRAISHLAAGNAVLENSNIPLLRWKFIGALQVPAYPTTNDMGDDLDLMFQSNNDLGRFVAEKSHLHGADQVVLYVGSPRDGVGVAWVLSNPGNVASPAHSVVRWSTSSATLAHELGHNFGCFHNREDDGRAFDGDGKYHYGYKSRDSHNLEWGTVMSYAPRIPYFSDPELTFQGMAIGVPETEPRAANNSRVLRNNGSPMANRRESISMPAITTHPRAVSVSRGTRFELEVTATGGSLQYQWKRDGANIPGAIGPTYLRIAAEDTDAGSYTVTVSNIAGEATSAAAAVAVTAPFASAPAGGGGGGGGGGGANSPWLVALTALLLFLRSRQQRRQAA